MGQAIGMDRRLLGFCRKADSTADQDKYKQPFDQQPGFFLKCLKNGFIVSNETKSARYAAFPVQ
jgi:hypothetical protein